MALFEQRPANPYSGSTILGDPLKAPAPTGTSMYSGATTSPPDSGFGGVTGPLALSMLSGGGGLPGGVLPGPLGSGAAGPAPGGASGYGGGLGGVMQNLQERLGQMGGARGRFGGFGSPATGDLFPGMERRRSTAAAARRDRARRASFGANASAFRNLFIPNARTKGNAFLGN